MPRIIPSEGPHDAKIVIVGEAPGADEEKAGRPFVGASGAALDNFLNSAGILRREVYITNVIKEHPLNNDIEPFIKLGKGAPRVSEVAQSYIRSLKNEIEAVRPNVVVALGNIPLWVLTGKNGIFKQRGSILESTLVPRQKVIGTIHPAATLMFRDPSGLHGTYARFDFKRIKEESLSWELNLPSRELLIGKSFDEIIAFLRDILHKSGKGENMPQYEVAFDIETSRDQVSCISFATSWDRSMSIPFTRMGKNIWTPEEEWKIWHWIGSILEDEGITKIGQNLHFDFSFLFDRYGFRISPLEDTMVAHWCLFPDLPKGLDFITSTLTREPYYKDEGKKYFKNPDNDEAFWLYNAKDSAICMEVWPILKKDLERFGNMEAYRRQKDLIPALVYMQTIGIKVNKDRLEEERTHVDGLIKDLTRQFQSECGYEINPNSVQQLQQHFYIRRGIKPYVNRKTGASTVDGDALKRIAAKGFKEATTLLELRHYTKLKGTYLDVTFDADGRLRGAYNPCGTKSGRLSSSETIFGTGTNVQNLPDEFKVFLEAD